MHPCLNITHILPPKNENRLTSKFERAKIFYREHMKSISLFLVFSMILCYTGLGVGLCRSYDPSKTMNCHISQRDRVSDIETTANSYKNSNATKHRTCVCYDALTNAPQGHDFNLKDFSYIAAVDIPTSKINKISRFSLSLTIRKEYQPRVLFLVNSSFLL